jgi:hypothetical protein
MSTGFEAENQYKEERDQIQRALETALQDNRTLRKVLTEIRPVLITRKHKRLVDKALRIRPPSE